MSQTIDVSNAVAPIKKTRHRLRFSTRALLVLLTVCCLGLACVAFPPLILISEMLSLVALATFCIAAIFYGRGWIRPFSILYVASQLVFFVVMINAHIGGPEEACVFFAVQLLGSIFVGMCGAAAHGFLKRWSGIVPIPNIPFLRDWLHNPEDVGKL